MPLYVYKCPKCGEVTENLLPIKERKTEFACGKCGDVLVRECTTALPIFCGSGFYCTDYGKAKKG